MPTRDITSASQHMKTVRVVRREVLEPKYTTCSVAIYGLRGRYGHPALQASVSSDGRKRLRRSHDRNILRGVAVYTLNCLSTTPHQQTRDFGHNKHIVHRSNLNATKLLRIKVPGDQGNARNRGMSAVMFGVPTPIDARRTERRG